MVASYTILNNAVASPLLGATAHVPTPVEGTEFALTITGPAGSYALLNILWGDDGVSWQPFDTITVNNQGPLSVAKTYCPRNPRQYWNAQLPIISPGAMATLTMTA